MTAQFGFSLQGRGALAGREAITRPATRAEALVVADTRLFDLDFTRLAIDLCDTFLNEAAHPEGLDRRACVALRGILLDQGVLRDLLRSVQPAAPGGNASAV